MLKIKYYSTLLHLVVTFKCFHYHNIIIRYVEPIVLCVLLIFYKQIHLSVSCTRRIYIDECKMYHSLKFILYTPSHFHGPGGYL